MKIKLEKFENKYSAVWIEQDPSIKGCPLGRGSTREGALGDLIGRTNMESGLTITLFGHSVHYKNYDNECQHIIGYTDFDELDRVNLVYKVGVFNEKYCKYFNFCPKCGTKI